MESWQQKPSYSVFDSRKPTCLVLVSVLLNFFLWVGVYKYQYKYAHLYISKLLIFYSDVSKRIIGRWQLPCMLFCESIEYWRKSFGNWKPDFDLFNNVHVPWNLKEMMEKFYSAGLNVLVWHTKRLLTTIINLPLADAEVTEYHHLCRKRSKYKVRKQSWFWQGEGMGNLLRTLWPLGRKIAWKHAESILAWGQFWTPENFKGNSVGKVAQK